AVAETPGRSSPADTRKWRTRTDAASGAGTRGRPSIAQHRNQRPGLRAHVGQTVNGIHPGPSTVTGALSGIQFRPPTAIPDAPGRTRDKTRRSYGRYPLSLRAMLRRAESLFL